MIYDKAFFDKGIDRRNTGSLKWDVAIGKIGENANPMWVADMDFECPEEIVNALKERAAHAAYGYTSFGAASKQAMFDFMKRRHGVTMEDGKYALMPCVITGLKAAVIAYTKPGDGVIIQQPVYHPFNASIEDNTRTVMNCPLNKDAEGRFTMDLEAVEKACAAGAKMMYLCNPHNPAGRAWTEQELRDLTALLARYHVMLISDEIHEDFVYAPRTFVSASLVAPEELDLICLTSASKTFNLAGLQQAVAYSSKKELIDGLTAVMNQSGTVSGNIFAMAATDAAYTYGDQWLDTMLAYIQEGSEILRSELAEKLPKAVMSPLEATYLAWVDLTAYGLKCDELIERCRANGVEFNPGRIFGEEGESFLRINLACPHSRIREAVESLARAVK